MTGPEKCSIHRVRFKFLIVALELPNLFAVLIKVAPPSKSHQKTPCHILHSPEIKGTQYDHADERGDIREEVTYDEVTTTSDAYIKKAANLNKNVKMQAIGCAALERLY